MVDFDDKKLLELEKSTEELKKLNEKLLQSEQLKSEFLSNIRNEINNPLTSILGLARMLMKSQNLSAEEVAKLGEMIYKEAFHLNLQMATIFAAADLEAGETQTEAKQVRVLNLIKEVIASFEEVTYRPKGKIYLEDQTNNDQLIITSDEEKLKLILSCLISNALNFSDEESDVKITLRINENDNLVIAIQDSGIGIAAADQKKIFDRFIQLDSGQGKKYHGLGLGLSVAEGLAEILGGAIHLQSEPGKGSEFEICLPRKWQMSDLAFWDDEDGIWECADAKRHENF